MIWCQSCRSPLRSVSRKKRSTWLWLKSVLTAHHFKTHTSCCGEHGMRRPKTGWTEENHALLMARCCIKCDTDVTWHLKGDRLSLADSMMDAPLRSLLLLTALGLNGKNNKNQITCFRSAKVWIYSFWFHFVLTVLGSEIIKGHKVPDNEMLYMASVQNASGHHVCGGFLISKDAVVTAAHCDKEWVT